MYTSCLWYLYSLTASAMFVLSDVTAKVQPWPFEKTCSFIYLFFITKASSAIPIRNTLPRTKRNQHKPNECRSVQISTDQLVSTDSSHIQSSDCVTTVLLYCNLSLCQACQPGHFVCHPKHMPLFPAKLANRSGKD